MGTLLERQIYSCILCDNLEVVQVLQTGKARDSKLATFVRNICLISSIFKINLAITHTYKQFSSRSVV